MPQLGLLSASPIVATPKLSEIAFEGASSLPKWNSPFGLPSASLVVVAPQLPKATFDASSGAVC